MKRTKGYKSTVKPGRIYKKRTFTEQQLNDAERLVGMYGARNKELSLYFDVVESTIDYWIANYPDFERAVRRGRTIIGLQVADALVRRAKGYKHKAVKIVMRKVKHYNEKGNITHETEEPLYVPYEKHYPPDANAAYKYLTIMFREVWAENNNMDININHSGTINYKKIEDIPVNELSESEKNVLFSLHMKQLKDVNRN